MATTLYGMRRPGAVRERWAHLLDRHDVLILDTETTGLGGDAEIVELAAIDPAGETRLNELVMPVGDVPREAAAIHGLTHERLTREGARPWPDLHDQVLDALGGRVLVGWSSKFDARMLGQTCARHGLVLPSGLLWVDLLGEYRRIRPRGRHRLVDAAAREGVSVERAHRALADCKTVLAVMRAVAGWRASTATEGTASDEGETTMEMYLVEYAGEWGRTYSVRAESENGAKAAVLATLGDVTTGASELLAWTEDGYRQLHGDVPADVVAL